MFACGVFFCFLFFFREKLKTVSHDWWETLFFTLSGHMTHQSGGVCQPRQTQRSFWGSLENNNATSICKDNETNGCGCFQPAAIICWERLHHNNWGGGWAPEVGIASQNVSIILAFTACESRQEEKVGWHHVCSPSVMEGLLLTLFSHTECFRKGSPLIWRSSVRSWTLVVKCPWAWYWNLTCFVNRLSKPTGSSYIYLKM